MPVPLRLEGDVPLARAKNTDRSAARRRARAAARATTVDERAAEETLSEAEQPRQPAFTLPNVPEDLRALPGMYRTRRALWIPVALLGVGFVAALALATQAAPVDVGLYLPFFDFVPFAVMAALFVQLFFDPSGMFTFFIGGFVAPRAAYLVGLVLGALNAVMWVVVVAIAPQAEAPIDPAPYVITALAFGPLAAAFAGWYRSFLRRMSAQNQARRAQREAELRARRRTERRAAKRPAG
jgi:hypothetical protein